MGVPGAGKRKWRISWGSRREPAFPVLCSCSLLSAPARAPLSLHLARAPTGPWEGQANITQGDKGGLEGDTSEAAETNLGAR